MLKREEIKSPSSCLNRARNHEMVFVLLARDEAAPHAIREWVERRIALAKNSRNDDQIIEALECARTMKDQRSGLQKDLKSA